MFSLPNFIGMVAFIVALIGGVLMIFPTEDPTQRLIIGASAYLLWRFAGAFFITRDLRQGRKLMLRRQYRDAITKFDEAYTFFADYPLFDRLRWVFTLNISKTSYKETCLLSAAYCHVLMQNKNEAREMLQQTLEEFPDSTVAKTSLEQVEAMDDL